jgi:hypothetical protein
VRGGGHRPRFPPKCRLQSTLELFMDRNHKDRKALRPMLQYPGASPVYSRNRDESLRCRRSRFDAVTAGVLDSDSVRLGAEGLKTVAVVDGDNAKHGNTIGIPPFSSSYPRRILRTLRLPLSWTSTRFSRYFRRSESGHSNRCIELNFLSSGCAPALGSMWLGQPVGVVVLAQ